MDAARGELGQVRRWPRRPPVLPMNGQAGVSLEKTTVSERAADVEAVVSAVVRATGSRRGEAIESAAASPLLRAPYSGVSATRLLRYWHTATLLRDFGADPADAAAFLDRVIDVADHLDELGLPDTDTHVRRVLLRWAQRSGAAGRGLPAGDGSDQLIVAMSIALSLRARQVSDTDADRELGAIARLVVGHTSPRSDGPFSWQDGVTMRLMRLSLTRSGLLRLTDLHESLVRAAVLVDLQTAGRLQAAEPENVLDSSATGFVPVDQLLTAVNTHPGRTMHHWLAKGPRLTRGLADELEAAHYWRRTSGHLQAPRYTHQDPNAALDVKVEVMILEEIADDVEIGTVADTTVTTLALLGRLITGRPKGVPDDFLDACAQNAWIVELARLVTLECYAREERAKGIARATSFG